MLDIVIIIVLLGIILASILRRGIQRLILIGLLVAAGILASGRIPDWFGNVLPDNSAQPTNGEVLTARAAFQDASRAIGGFLAQEGLSNGSDNIASDPGTAVDEGDGSSSSDGNTTPSDAPPETVPPNNLNQPGTQNQGTDDYQRAWW